jgi:thymidylate synthase
MKQYLNLLTEILTKGVEKESGRANMPNTIGLSRGTILMENIEENFPLLTTKKMFLRGIVEELLWFLRGETNIKPLVDKDVNIWNGDAYRWYLKYCDGMGIEEERRFSMEEFIETIKAGHLDRFSKDSTGIPDYLLGSVYPIYRLGDLGKVYGYQWRNQNGVDQIMDIIKEIKDNPYGRYKILDAWNKKDFPEMALPPCHLLYQFIVRPMSATQREDYFAKLHGFNEEQRWEMNPNATDEDVHKIMDEEGIPRFYLDLNMYQRSCDTFLGVPFNLASMSLLLLIIAKMSGMVAGDAFWIGGDTHLYVNHVSVVVEQLQREPYQLPKLLIKKELKTLEDVLALTIDDFELVDYQCHPAIKAELFTGLKK